MDVKETLEFLNFLEAVFERYILCNYEDEKVQQFAICD